MLVTLDDIKRHLNIDLEYTGDDIYLESIAEVSESVVQRYICKSFASLLQGDGSLPSPLKQAILLYIGVLYNNRESVAYANAVEVPQTLTFLLDLYKDYSDTTSDAYKAEASTAAVTGAEIVGNDLVVTLTGDDRIDDALITSEINNGTLTININEI